MKRAYVKPSAHSIPRRTVLEFEGERYEMKPIPAANWTNTDCIHLRRYVNKHDEGPGEDMEACDYDGIGGMITETCEGCPHYEPKKEEE